MNEYQVKQLAPNHADHISCYKQEYVEAMIQNEPVVAQLKYDGERMLIHIDGENVYCTSRRFSKKTGNYMENQDRLPYLKDAIKHFAKEYKLGYTVLDCECYAKNWSEAASVLHSLPERAKELQDNGIDIKYAIFDCLFYDGNDIRNLPYIQRFYYAVYAIQLLGYSQMHTAKFLDCDGCIVSFAAADFLTTSADWQNRMQAAVEDGFEGIVIKSLTRKYYDKAALLKCKKFETVDVVVIDYQQGNGKYANTIGALIVGYYDEIANDFVRISKVNCSTDEERDWWRDNWSMAKNSIIEVKCQEITDKSLRHPVYIRRRPDKDFKMCKKDTIFKEIN